MAQPVAPQTLAGAQLAGWGSRVGAYIIDFIIALLVYWVGIALAIAGEGAIGGVLIVLGLVVAFLYYPLTVRRGGDNNGQTIGKQLFGIRARRDNGQPYDFGQALLREFVIKYLLFGVVGGFFLAIPTLINFLWPLWDDQNRALHDMLASSHVVRA